MTMPHPRSRRWWQLAVLVAWMVAGAGSARIDPAAYVGGRVRDEEERIRRNSSAVAAMLGEFRTSISDIMFIKTERYLHGGIAYLPHHSESALTVEDLADEVDEHQLELGMPGDDEEEHAGVPTIIPPPHRDFRGWIGTLHREVRPWRDPRRTHIHTDGRELLPWFRVMTQVDPQYVRGYVAGAFWLAQVDREQAADFIAEGLQHNPEAFQLYVSLGLLRLREARAAAHDDEDGPAVANTLWERARDDFRRAAKLALTQRPDDVDDAGFGSGGWGRYHENDALTAARMDYLLTRETEGASAAADRLERYRHVFPELAP